jgi:Ca2+/Na+ antiporter
MWEFLAVGGLFFWIATAIVIWAIAYSLTWERFPGTRATGAILLYFIALALFGGFNVFKAAAHHPIWAVVIAISYFVLGFLWSTQWRWGEYLNDRRTAFDARVRQFYNEKHLVQNTLNDSDFADFNTFCNVNGGHYFDLAHYPPQFIDNKTNLIRWASWWPFDAALTLWDDFAARIWSRALETVSGMLQAKSDSKFADLVAARRKYADAQKPAEVVVPPVAVVEPVAVVAPDLERDEDEEVVGAGANNG